MGSDAARKTLLTFYDAVNRHDIDALDHLLAPEVVDHEVPDELGQGLKGVKQFMASYLAAFPDIHFEALDTIAEGNVVCARARVTGTHTGEFLGIPATNKMVDIEISDWVRFDDQAKAVEHWGYTDNLELLQQLGVISDSP